MSHDLTSLRRAHLCFGQTLAVLVLGLIPLPLGWATARSVLESARSPELNRAERESSAGGYNRVLGPDFQWTPNDKEQVVGQLLFSST